MTLWCHHTSPDHLFPDFFYAREKTINLLKLLLLFWLGFFLRGGRTGGGLLLAGDSNPNGMNLDGSFIELSSWRASCGQWARGFMCWFSQNSYPNPTQWVLLLPPFFNILKKLRQKQEKSSAQSHSCDSPTSVGFQSPCLCSQCRGRKELRHV